jgi:transcriptional regulator with XRE-family HTH domain
MKAISSIFAQNVRRYREIKGLTQAELSERVGISINFLSQIEGNKKFPSPQVVDSFIRALELEPQLLFIDWDGVKSTDNELVSGVVSKTFLEGLEKSVTEYTARFFAK